MAPWPRAATPPAPTTSSAPRVAPATPGPTYEVLRETPGPTYEVLRETPSENALKAQLDARIIVDQTLNEAELRAVLLDYVDQARAHRGWTRHERTTRVYAYAYASEADANGSGNGWLAMASWSYPAEPLVSFSRDHMAAAAAGPVERHGMSEEERRAIFGELMRADAEALAHAYDDPTATDASERRVSRRHRLPIETVRAIGAEGVSLGWGW